MPETARAIGPTIRFDCPTSNSRDAGTASGTGSRCTAPPPGNLPTSRGSPLSTTRYETIRLFTSASEPPSLWWKRVTATCTHCPVSPLVHTSCVESVVEEHTVNTSWYTALCTVSRGSRSCPTVTAVFETLMKIGETLHLDLNSRDCTAPGAIPIAHTMSAGPPNAAGRSSSPIERTYPPASVSARTHPSIVMAGISPSERSAR
mmetsp:Transcript_40084/g.95064  ORF Transcript_40084/g.95064 Transcript_40084/m.95064 type:complete len:204 (-) Transcript_40084:242-853(-)